VLAVTRELIGTGVDSESWTCARCGGQMIGRRPVDDLCQECLADAAPGFRPMDTGGEL
jgi:hypothetical protein